MTLEVIDEVRTRRFVVLDTEERERIVGEVVNGVAELRLDLPARGESRSGVLLFTHPGEQDVQLGPTIGVHVWADGNAVIELTLWRDDAGDWTRTVVLDDRG